MKFNLKSLTVLIFTAIIFSFLSMRVQAQVVNETTKKKISFGVGLINDFWLDPPSDIKIRAINQGFQAFGAYNVPFGKSNFGFSIGLGLTSHNMFGDFVVDRKADSVFLQKLSDTVDWKKSKINMTYVEVPIEFNFKSKSKISVGIGFKLGMLAGSNTKYKGEGTIKTNQYEINTPGETVRFRTWGIRSLEQFVYGPTIRVGYKWFNLNAYYQLSGSWKKGLGPEMHPISVGFVIMPF